MVVASSKMYSLKVNPQKKQLQKTSFKYVQARPPKSKAEIPKIPVCSQSRLLRNDTIKLSRHSELNNILRGVDIDVSHHSISSLPKVIELETVIKRAPSKIEIQEDKQNEEMCETFPADGVKKWPKKSDMYLVRQDGNSCSREFVRGSGKLTFAYPSANQHLLIWRQRPKTALVVKKLGEGLFGQLEEVTKYLGEVEGMQVLVEPQDYNSFGNNVPEYVNTYKQDQIESLSDQVDFVVCLGGDGVLLHVSDLFKKSIPPIISFHLGSLGFLTNHNFGSFREDLANVINGCKSLEHCSFDESIQGVHVALRMRLACEIIRDGKVIAQHDVLNEVVIGRGVNSYLSNVEVYESGRFITTVQADGVMLATPTGSTAYSVAAGGSMVHPNVSSILFTPICPHSLSFKPVILPDYADIVLRVPEAARSTAWVSFDGKHNQEMQRGDQLRVRMSSKPVPTINQVDLTSDWFSSLDRCFNWSNRVVQQPLE